MNKIKMLGLSFMLALFSCTEPNVIGLEIQPGTDQITISTLQPDAIFLSTISVVEDSVRTDQNPLHLLGAYIDPVFGESKASFTTQLLLSESIVDFGENPTLDSAILSIAYSNPGYYGDTTDIIDLEISRLEDVLFSDSAYYSDQEFNSSIIADYAFSPMPNKYIYTDTDTVGAPLIKIRIDNLGQYILDATSDQLNDNLSFVEYLKGIQLRVTNINGSILYFNLNNIRSKFTIFYNDTLSFDLVMGTGAVNLNHFENEHILSPSINAVQSMGGYNLRIQIDGESNNYTSLKDSLSGASINKVMLTFNQEDNSDLYLPHPQLGLLRTDSYYYLDDFFEGSAHFGGYLESGQYSFNITKYFTRLINDEINIEDIYLMRLPMSVTTNANRTILSDEIELNITYTKF